MLDFKQLANLGKKILHINCEVNSPMKRAEISTNAYFPNTNTLKESQSN